MDRELDGSTTRQTMDRRAAREGRLVVRPRAPSTSSSPGLAALGLNPRRDAWLYIPPTYRSDHPAPLLVCLHGAGGKGRNHLDHLRPLADEHGVVLLGPTSQDSTWDVIYSEYGPDVLLIDRALEETFNRVAIDQNRVGVEGFSDGASYALSIGVANGDLFTYILAFSPGFMAPLAQRGNPRIFVSHGTSDPVLRIETSSHRLVPRLEQAGYDVKFIEFPDGHTVPDSIARSAVDWYLAPRPVRP